jgi:hypothetical protein
MTQTAIWNPDRRLFLQALLMGVVSIAAVSDIPEIPISCERHDGDFSDDFSSDFDISSIDCKIGVTHYDIVVRFFRAVWPVVSIGP